MKRTTVTISQSYKYINETKMVFTLHTTEKMGLLPSLPDADRGNGGRFLPEVLLPSAPQLGFVLRKKLNRIKSPPCSGYGTA